MHTQRPSVLAARATIEAWPPIFKSVYVAAVTSIYDEIEPAAEALVKMIDDRPIDEQIGVMACAVFDHVELITTKAFKAWCQQHHQAVNKYFTR
jgi:hypothetical protein